MKLRFEDCGSESNERYVFGFMYKSFPTGNMVVTDFVRWCVA